jgi:glutathione S-transferase
MHTLRVLGHERSINVRKVLWLLDRLGLAYAREDLPTPARPLDGPEFRALNPNAQVPVLVDGEFVLWESNTICRYLVNRERRHDLLPIGARARARVEQWIDWQATDLNDAWRYAFMSLVRHHPSYADPESVRGSLAAWAAKLAVLEAQLASTRAHVAGEAFTLADVVIGLSVHRWTATPAEKPALPAVEAYYARLREDPAFRRYASVELP